MALKYQHQSLVYVALKTTLWNTYRLTSSRNRACICMFNRLVHMFVCCLACLIRFNQTQGLRQTIRKLVLEQSLQHPARLEKLPKSGETFAFTYRATEHKRARRKIAIKFSTLMRRASKSKQNHQFNNITLFTTRYHDFPAF